MNDDQYRSAIRELSRLIDTGTAPGPGDPDFARVDDLVERVLVYERANFPIEPPSPEAADLFRREQMGETVDWDAMAPAKRVVSVEKQKRV